MTKKHNAPRVLTVDDGKEVIRRTNSSPYSFVFSDNILDWIKGKQRKFNEANPERWKGYNYAKRLNK